MTKKSNLPIELIEKSIYLIRDKKVMLDRDLANLYEVETKVLNQAVRRNLKRFPDDFMFQLNKEEYESLRSQIVTLEKSSKGEHRKYLPYAFTEQGIAMLSGIHNSDRAISVNIRIMRAFVRLREMIMSHKELGKKFINLEKKYDKQFFGISGTNSS